MKKTYKTLLGILLAASLAILPACQATPDGPYSGPAAPDSPASSQSPSSEKEESQAPAPAEKVPASSEEPPPSSSSQSLPHPSSGQEGEAPQEVSPPSPAPPVMTPPASSAPVSQTSLSRQSPLGAAEIPAPEESAGGREGIELIKGKKVSLLEWQWVDSARLALLTYYADADETLMLLYNRENLTIKKLARFSGRPKSVLSPFYENQVEFLLDGYSLMMDRESLKPDIGLPEDDNDLLPQADSDYGYWGVSFSSSRKYFFYERFPNEYRRNNVSVSDRILIDNVLSASQHTPTGEIAFPFDVRVTPKKAQWLCWNDRLLVEADLPQENQYGQYRRTYYIYNASGREVTNFRMEENDLSLRDTYRNLLLFERAGEPYTLLCYDYISGVSRTAAVLEGENRPFGAARFSPDGKQIALLRPNTDLTPQFYPVPDME